jgi:hypothetical protein
VSLRESRSEEGMELTDSSLGVAKTGIVAVRRRRRSKRMDGIN